LEGSHFGAVSQVKVKAVEAAQITGADLDALARGMINAKRSS